MREQARRAISTFLVVCGVVGGASSTVAAALLHGSITPPTPSANWTLTGSFGNQSISQTANFDLATDIAGSSVVYEEITFSTVAETVLFSGLFTAPDASLLEIQLRFEPQFAVRLDRPSPVLDVLPILGGGFAVDAFRTNNPACDFHCYDLFVTGSFELVGPTETITGSIDSAFLGRAIGADLTTNIVPFGLPGSAELRDFRFHGNTGGASIPRLIDATVDGIRIVLDANYGTFEASQASVALVPEPSAATLLAMTVGFVLTSRAVLRRSEGCRSVSNSTRRIVLAPAPRRG